jgi:hypothetical protein
VPNRVYFVILLVSSFVTIHLQGHFVPAFRRPAVLPDWLSAKEKKTITTCIKRGTYKTACGPYFHIPFFSVGKLGDKVCTACGALMFGAEVKRGPPYWCCNNGATPYKARPYPDVLGRMFMGPTPRHRRVQSELRCINNALALGTFFVKRARVDGRGPSVFRVCGMTYLTLKHMLHWTVKESKLLKDKDKLKNGQLVAFLDNTVVITI